MSRAMRASKTLSSVRRAWVSAVILSAILVKKASTTSSGTLKSSWALSKTCWIRSSACWERNSAATAPWLLASTSDRSVEISSRAAWTSSGGAIVPGCEKVDFRVLLCVLGVQTKTDLAPRVRS